MEKIKYYIYSFFIGIIGIIYVYFKGIKVGKEEEEAKQNEETLEAIKKSAKTSNKIITDNDSYTKLRDKYQRD